MRKKLAVLLSGLAVAGALVTPVAAHAATTIRVPPGTLIACSYMQNVYTQKWATDVPDKLWLYFEDVSEETNYCFYQQSNGQDEIQDQTTGNCLSENTSALDKDGHPEVGEESCTVNQAWDQWAVDQHKDNAYFYDVFYNDYLYKNSYQCLYDNTQEPAIVTVCPSIPTTNNFFWFYLPTG
jgi:hypothetical protein